MKYIDFTLGNNYVDEAVENYLIHGFEPGGFLTSVLANDLYLAAGRADTWNRENLADIAHTVVINMPESSIGSYQRVKDWCSDKDGRRTRYAEYIREKKIIEKLENSY
jgi:hypothetical protein